MADLLVDRFLSTGACQIDLASGAAVRIHLAAAGTTAGQAVWSDCCATLARLRHPLLNPLVDYGAADTRQLFEAYVVSPPLRASGAPAARLVAHAARFLETHALTLAPDRAKQVLREVLQGPAARGRPLGLVLQPRLVLEAIGEVLHEAAPGGVVTIDVRGPAGSGLRTLWMLAARKARLEGYVPIAAPVLERRPWLADALLARHVALLLEHPARHAGAQHVAAAFIARLGAASARRHVLITFGRAEHGDRRALQVDRMGGAAMHAMVYHDRADGPSMEEVREGIRLADGVPGTLVERLRGAPFAPRSSRLSVVHESSPHYVITPARAVATGARRRVSASLARAAPRAERLAAAGRHGAAARLLDRAVRVLEGRAEPLAAAQCALALGWIHRDRGRSADALRHFEHARALATGTPTGLRATTAIAIVWTDEERLIDAEALLRSAQSAAALVEEADEEAAAVVALARVVLWQKRVEEAWALLAPALTSDARVQAWALAARIHVAAGSAECAGRAASRAIESAAAVGTPRALAIGARAMVMARAAAGDAHGVRQAALDGIAAAAAAHLPLLALRLRTAWLVAARGAESAVDRGNAHQAAAASEAERLQAQLTSALKRPLPALLRRQLEAACEVGASPERPAPRDGAITDLRQLLEATQTAPDDRAALQSLADAVVVRLRGASVVIVTSHDTRVVVRAGRPWGGEPRVAIQAIAAGSVICMSRTPPECATPISYGRETIGALACRWSAGIAVDLDHAGAVCGAAALAAAASLRSLADRTPAPQEDPTWNDLLGTSPSAGELRRAILNAARAPFPVLILGESGSGKEVVARAIHRLGPRRHRRLCTINCAALSDELVEAELFGHTRGAFTGALAERAGLFEEADGGTLFLDEVGELSGRAQAKLLRVVQDGEVRRVGENLPRRVDTRIVAATNRALEEERDGFRFRADLRFRLDVIRIVVPPLRDRATDIPAMVAHFWEDAAARVGSRATLTPETVAALTRYDWPGNVRELQNAVASLAVHGPRRGRITPGTLPQQVARCGVPETASFETAREEFERRYVRAALARAGGHRVRAAHALGVSRQGLAKMLRRLGIDAPRDDDGWPAGDAG